MSLSKWLRKAAMYRRRSQAARRRRAVLPAPCQLETLENRCLLSAIQFAQPVYQIAEGTWELDVTLTRDDASETDSVLVVATGGTATGGGFEYWGGPSDYWEGAFPVNAIFEPGERETTATLVLISPKGDQVLEGVETIELGLVANDDDVTFGGQDSATIEIHDAALSIESPSRYVHEDGRPHTFTVVLHMADGFALSEDAVFEVSVDHGVAWPAVVFPDGIRRGAVSSNDYVFNTTTLRFAAGSQNGATQTITLTPIRDDVQEGIEGFFFRLKQISGTPFDRHIKTPGRQIIDVPEEWIGQRPPFVRSLPSPGQDVTEGRRDADVDAGLITTPAENASGGTASTGGVASLVGTVPVMVTGSASTVLFATEAPMIPVPEFQTPEPLPLGRMDLLAEFLSGSEPLSGLEEPGANGPGTTTSSPFAANSDSFESDGLDSAFSDDELLGDLTLLGPVI